MDPVLVILIILLGGGGVLIGWLVPPLFKSEPPYGLAVDILASVLIALVWGVPWHLWGLKAIGLGDMPKWLLLLGVLADSWGFALIVLWLLRKIKR
jgi:hypothetical protein